MCVQLGADRDFLWAPRCCHSVLLGHFVFLIRELLPVPFLLRGSSSCGGFEPPPPHNVFPAWFTGQFISSCLKIMGFLKSEELCLLSVPKFLAIFLLNIALLSLAVVSLELLLHRVSDLFHLTFS